MEVIRLESRRRRVADAEGRVGRRRFGSSSARDSLATSRASARARLRLCDLVSLAEVDTTGPSLAHMRNRAHSGKLAEAATFRVASALVWEVLTCWPPGPPDVENRQAISLPSSSTPVARCRAVPLSAFTVTPSSATLECYHGGTIGRFGRAHISVCPSKSRRNGSCRVAVRSVCHRRRCQGTLTYAR